MGRFTLVAESQVAQLSGVNATTTVNGVIGSLVAGAAANYKLRRVKCGMRAGTSAIADQQITIALYRQTVRAVGTGLTNIVGTNMDSNGSATAIGGFDVSTAATIGTTGWTLTTKLDEWSFNAKVGLDLPWEFMEEFVCPLGTANGFAFVNIGNTLPASGLVTLGIEWEE
jgi:hypothetical protein